MSEVILGAVCSRITRLAALEIWHLSVTISLKLLSSCLPSPYCNVLYTVQCQCSIKEKYFSKKLFTPCPASFIIKGLCNPIFAKQVCNAKFVDTHQHAYWLRNQLYLPSFGITCMRKLRCSNFVLTEFTLRFFIFL